MAPPKSQKSIARPQKDKTNVLQKVYKKYANVEFVKSLIFDPAKLPIVAYFILLGEFLLNIIVVHRVNYTEIDWKAYMQECEGFLNGTTNYALLKGDTGPLVYPAGFVYVYSVFYFLTSHGENIRLAQYIFIGIYLLQMFFVLRLYSKSRKLPPFVLVLSAFTSYRIHSIYVLRLFNDPIAVLFFYISLNLFVDRKWYAGSIFFSLAVSIKMNILLFAPAILLLYITNLGYLQTIIQLAICGIVQLILGAPFLLTYPVEYLKGSFDLGRIFEHKWTVNYRFLSRDVFENKIFHIALLCLHLILLAVFTRPSFKYLKNYCRLRSLEAQLQPQIDAKNRAVKADHKSKESSKSLPKGLKNRKIIENQEVKEEEMTKEQQTFLDSFEKSMKKASNYKEVEKEEPATTEAENYAIHFDKSVQLAILPIFLANFIGMVCARSLHYQFYVWYFHTLPYLVWYTEYRQSLKFLLLGLIEFAWNTYPSTIVSSVLIHVCHMALLYGIARKFCRGN